jgi:hypothetical protein
LSANLNALMLGGRGFGKTCFMASMYNQMSFGVEGFLLTASDFDQRLMLDQFWMGLAKGKCPDGTLEGQDLLFDCAYAFDPIMPVSWYDYPGGWLRPEKASDRANYDALLNHLEVADFVMCCIPIDQLLDAYKAKRQLLCFQQYNNLFLEYGKRKPLRFPSVMYVITKADLGAGSDEVVGALDFYVTRSPFRGERWPEISVVPVSLGMEITIDDKQILSLDALNPVNVHVPVLYAISKKLSLLIDEALKDLEKIETMMKGRKVELGKLSDGLIRRWWNSAEIDQATSGIEGFERTRKELSAKCEELAQQVEQVNCELARSSPVIYHEGKRIKRD